MKIKFQKISRNLPVENHATTNLIPYHFYPYLFDMNCIYATADPNIVFGREKEIERIFNCFLRSKKKNVVLLGGHGVGKTAILQKAVSRIIQGRCPKELKMHHFVFLDVQYILANIEKEKMQKKLKKVVEFIGSYSNLVVVIDQVHLVQADYTLSYYFSLLIKQQHVPVIGLTTEEDFYDFFEFDAKTRERIEIISVKEPKPNEIYPMIKNVINTLEKQHGVTISQELVEYIISIAGAFPTELYNPEVTLDIIEKSMVYAKRKKQKVVTKQLINNNFNFDYELYHKISEKDKLVTAYHEAGHFVSNEKSNNIRDTKTTAITIVPAEDFLGITMFEIEKEKQLFCDRDYYIDNIAVDLAGRVAEEILNAGKSKEYSSGACADLRHATNTARAIITQYGMMKNCGEHMAYLGNYDYADFLLLSNENKTQINQETKNLIDEAHARAKKILEENIQLLDKVARELLVNEVLDRKDLDRICKACAEEKASE